MQAHLLESNFVSMLDATTRADIEQAMAGFARGLGFSYFSGTVVRDHVGREPDFISIDNTPASYQALYNDVAFSRRDPVLQHCKRSSVPIAWSQSTYVRAQRGEKWEEQARHGYRNGICVAMHLPAGLHFVLGVDREDDLPASPDELTQLVAAVQLCAVHAHEAAMRVVFAEEGPCEIRALTPRELETLRWTMEGKTAWEIGRILGIAENTVIRHLHAATRKLDCSNKLHAVVKAMRLGLIR